MVLVIWTFTAAELNYAVTSLTAITSMFLNSSHKIFCDHHLLMLNCVNSSQTLNALAINSRSAFQ